MNTFLKILIVIALFLLVTHLFPLALVPFAVLGLILLGVLGFCGLLAGVGLVGCVVAFSLVVAVIAALSPLWVPVALLIGLISLCRRQRPSRTA